MKHLNQNAIPQHILEESADWLMCFNEGQLSQQQQQDFIHWQHASPEHTRAWQKAQRLLDNFEHIPSDIAALTLNRPEDASRRAAMLKLAFFIGAVPLVGGGGGGGYYYQLNSEQADYISKVGEQRNITLPDGSELLLNTDSQLDVFYNQEQRLIHLHSGEILVETAANTNSQNKRPFKVQLNNIELKALGTRFIVRTASTNKVRKQHYLAVTAGAVQISLANRQEKIVINAGEEVYFTDSTIQPITAIIAVNTAWSNGMLMADSMRLDDFVNELSRYRNGVIRVDASIANLAVSGAFPLDNIEQSLAMLLDTYPIKMRSLFFSYWQTLTPIEK